MAITVNDIRLFQSQDNTDEDSGGGARTRNEVIDAQVNNLFPDISRIDTVSGDVALRKVFPVVNTDNRDIYYGAHTMLRDTPNDPNVSALLFYTNSAFDQRSEAQNDIEAYVVPSFRSTFYLFGRHIEGARAVTFLQREEETLPDVGEVYYLEHDETNQYIRIISIESTVITLTYQNADYRRRRVIATIDQPLASEFIGSEFRPEGQQPNTASTFDTQVADAAKYYGTKTLNSDAIAGGRTVDVDDIFEQLVPSTKAQTPLVNQQALQNGEILVPDPNGIESREEITYADTIILPSPISPGTLRGSSLEDDGNGNLTIGGVPSGTIDYKSGTISVTRSISGGNTVFWIPASVYVAGIDYSVNVAITQENQGTVYVRNVTPIPTAPNYYVEYRSQGRWYRILANDDGTLGNDPQVGVGTLNDNGDGSATFSITLGALPDIGSDLIFSWGSGETTTTIRDEINDQATMTLQYQLPHSNIVPTSLDMTLTTPNGNTTITSNANNELVTNRGAAIDGYFDDRNGLIVIETLNSNSVILPSVGTTDDVVLQYDTQDTPAPSDPGGENTINNPAFTEFQPTIIEGGRNPQDWTGYRHQLGQPITEGYLEVFLDLRVGTSEIPLPWWETEVCRLWGKRSGFLQPSTHPSGLIFGDYKPNGEVTIYIRKNAPRNVINPNYSPVTISGSSRVSGGYQPNAGINYVDPRDVKLGEFVGVTSIILQTERIPDVNPKTTHNLTQTFSQNAQFKIGLVPNLAGSITMEAGRINTVGQDIVSRGTNVHDYPTNAQIGTIDNSNGIMTLSYWKNLTSFSTVAYSAFVDVTLPVKYVEFAAFRTAAQSLVTSSFQLRYTTENGTFTATTNSDGEFTGTDIDTVNSYVDTITGLAVVFFTARVDPESIRYDAVAETTLPLDPELLGLNPVRLPSNGRVPVFQAGSTLIIFNEESTDIGTPAAGSVTTLGRQLQAYIEVVDVNGKRLDRAQFTADRENGTVTFADPLVLQDKYDEALTPPLTVIDRVEDMVLCSNAQINGTLGLVSPLSRDYPAGSKVASALVWGDIGARYFNLFSQVVFSGEWSDTPDRDQTTARYDDINYPIQVTNKDSLAGRWMIQFTGTTSVQVVHEVLGIVEANINIATDDVMPINPATSAPYFVMLRQGFGSGWVRDNIIRFNMESGDENMWVIRTVQPGQLTQAQDSMELEIRGDAN